MIDLGKIAALDERDSLLFCAALSERQFPNYALFCEVSGFAESKIARNCLNLIWESLCFPHTAVDFEKQLLKLEPVIPEARDFDIYGVFPAVDFCSCICETIDAFAQAEAGQWAENCSATSFSGIAQFIDYSEGREVDEDDDELWLAECDFQHELLRQLQESGESDKEFVKAFRKLAENEGVSNIGISMEMT